MVLDTSEQIWLSRSYVYVMVLYYRGTHRSWRRLDIGRWMFQLWVRARILVQATIHRRLRIGQDGHLHQSEPYEIIYFRNLYENTGPAFGILSHDDPQSET